MPCFYICPVTSTPDSMLHWRQQAKDDQRLGSASADTQRDRGNGSRLYEVNSWTWRYGRGHPRKVSIAGSGASVSARAGLGHVRQGSCLAKRPSPGLPTLAAAQNEPTAYDIMYDIYVLSFMISFSTQRLWYHMWYHCMITYLMCCDIIGVVVNCNLWYWSVIWSDILYDITYDIIHKIIWHWDLYESLETSMILKQKEWYHIWY